MYRHREDDRQNFEHLEHRLENNTKSPYPSFYQGLSWVEPERQQQRHLLPPEEPQNNKNNNRGGGPRVPREYFDDNCALWIGNLDPRVSDTILFELFCQAGTIKNISFPGKNQENDLSARFCFVNFMMPDSVPRAIDMMQGTVLFGRKLFLKYRPNSIHAMPIMMNKYQQSIYHHHQNQKWNRVNHNNNHNQNIVVSDEVSRTLPSVVNYKGKHNAPKGQHERSRSVSSDQGQGSFPENDEHSPIKKYSPVRAPSPNAVDPNDTVDVDSSPYKTGTNHNMKLSRNPPYYYNAAHCRSANTPTRKVMIKSSSGTNIPHHHERERTPECDGEYDPTDPEIR